MDTARNGRAGRDGILRAGIASGVLAAVAMMAFMMFAAALEGEALGPLRAVGTSFRGADASTAGAGPVAWGIFLHLAVGAALGLAFTAVVPRDLGGAASSVLGAGCGVIAMAIALLLVVPRFAPGLHARMPAHGGAWVIACAVFGAVAGLGPWLRRRMDERARRGTPQAGPGVLRPRTSP